MATITYRKLDANGDPLYGNGQGNFVSDIDAVAQAISTRLKLLQGEWWENINAGTPDFQVILGHSGAGKNKDAIGLLLQQRVLGTPYVTAVLAASYNFDPASRTFTFSISAETAFGQLTVTNITPGAQGAALY